VEQSFESSLEHLGVSSLDSYVLHGPSRRSGWHAEDEEAWAAMESLHASGRTSALGVSNVSIDQLELLCARSRVRPRYVQNRCYARMGWDAEVREFCSKHQLRYQGFSLLTANPEVMRSGVVTRAAKRLKRTAAQVIFRFACDVGMLPLTGTTDQQHMREDLALDFTLTEEEIREIARTGS
jgi:diketogulonate reductase-like aldo/keto reductase